MGDGWYDLVTVSSEIRKFLLRRLVGLDVDKNVVSLENADICFCSYIPPQGLSKLLKNEIAFSSEIKF